MLAEVSIREVDPEKCADTLIELHKKTFHEDDMDTELFTDGVWWIAYLQGKPVGFCGFNTSQRYKDSAYLCRAGVIPSARGRGLQKKMIRVRLARAKKMGYQWALTDTCDNPKSANNLIDCGFKMYQPAEPYGLPRAVYWLKRL